MQNILLKGLTEESIEKLKVWINGIKEVNMCSGSVKLKSELDQIYTIRKLILKRIVRFGYRKV